MKVLVATAMYPTADRPGFGSFVRTQIESLRLIGVDAEAFVLEGRSRKAMYARAVARLRRRLAEGDVDVVHAHYSYVGAVARMQRARPIVLTFHGDDLLGTVGPDGRHTLLSRGVAAAGKLLTRVVDAVVVQNRAMAAVLSGHPNIHVIPHEVDLDLFAPSDRDEARRTLGLAPDRRYLLFASPPDIPVKRFPLAAEVADELRRRDPSVELLVVFKEPQQRLALYMSAADALVFPSYQEGSPNIVKQAMACNLPIVATDVGDVAEVIADTDGCFVVEPTVEGFLAPLRTILETRPRTSGRDAVRHFAGPLVAARLNEVYAELVERRRPEAVSGLRPETVSTRDGI